VLARRSGQQAKANLGRFVAELAQAVAGRLLVPGKIPAQKPGNQPGGRQRNTSRRVSGDALDSLGLLLLHSLLLLAQGIQLERTYTA
jgi:hypothetical protein